MDDLYVEYKKPMNGKETILNLSGSRQEAQSVIS